MTLAESGTPRDVQGTWVGDELARALSRVDALTHALEVVQGGLRLQQEEIARLTEQLQVVDGRSQRHDAGQDAARDVRQEVARLEAAIQAESSLRRDLGARVERDDARDSETRRELQRVLEQIASRLDAVDGKQASIVERGRYLAEEVAGQASEGEGVEARLSNLERQIAAGQDMWRRSADEAARVAAALPDALARIEEMAGRLRASVTDQRRLEEDVAALRAVRDREEALLDVLEQQRVTRARMEERLNTVEETVQEVRRAQAAAAESLTLIEHDLAGEIEQHRAIGERIEAQRDLVAEHLRRALTAQEASARRRIEEMEQDIRTTRGLLVRLDESAAETTREQPL